MANQVLGAGAVGAVVEGNDNDVTIKNITINKVRKKIKVSQVLAYSIDRAPQLHEIKTCTEAASTPTPRVYLAIGDYQDAPETLAKRVSEQCIIADDCRVVDPDFRACQNPTEFVETWSKSLYNIVCAASPNPNAHDLEAYWQSIISTLESSGDQCIVINCHVIDEKILASGADVWLTWIDHVKQRFSQLKQPGRILIFLSFTPQSSMYSSPIVHWKIKKTIRKIEESTELTVVKLPEFDAINRNHCLDWCDVFFLQWLNNNKDNFDDQKPEDLRSDVKLGIDQLFIKNDTVPLRQVGDALRQCIQNSINH